MKNFADYIGLPWIKDAVGPDAFNCWTFVQFIEREHFGRELPDWLTDADKIMDVARSINEGLNGDTAKGWDAVECPAHGDVVLMAHSSFPSHIGVWLDIDGGGCIHCVRGSGVVFSSLTNLQLSGWGHLRYYRYGSVNCTR